jgi:hypothetical protein
MVGDGLDEGTTAARRGLDFGQFDARCGSEGAGMD